MPGAAFNPGSVKGVPTLIMNCVGEPIILDPWPGPNFTVRMTLDGDVSSARDVSFGSWRAYYLPAYDPSLEAWQTQILSASTLRMTLVTNPRLDVLYTLHGLSAALREAGCS